MLVGWLVGEINFLWELTPDKGCVTSPNIRAFNELLNKLDIVSCFSQAEKILAQKTFYNDFALCYVISAVYNTPIIVVCMYYIDIRIYIRLSKSL